MRKGRDGEKKKRKEKKKRMTFLVATTSLPAVYPPHRKVFSQLQLTKYI